MYTPFKLGANEYPAFRSVNRFESFANFLAANTLNVAEFAVERCTVTGQAFAVRDSSVIRAMIRMVATEIVQDGDKDILNPPTQSEIEDWANAVFDRIAYRLIMTSRPSPLFAISAGRLSLAHMDQQAQTVALLSMLLLDPVNRKSADFDSNDHYRRLCAVFSIADDIMLMQESHGKELSEIHSLLVELDAKYSIARVTFTSHEQGIKDKVIKADILGDLKTLKHLLVTMLNYRDQNVEVVEGAKRWTQEAFTSGVVTAVKRTQFSNIFEAMAKENKPSNRHIKKPDESKPKNKGGRPVKDQAKADRRARMAAQLAKAFNVPKDA